MYITLQHKHMTTHVLYLEPGHSHYFQVARAELCRCSLHSIAESPDGERISLMFRRKFENLKKASQTSAGLAGSVPRDHWDIVENHQFSVESGSDTDCPGCGMSYCEWPGSGN
jgi:hypothetical protein